MSKEQFLEEIKKLNIELTEIQIKQLEVYAEELLKYNEHTNLTAIKTMEEVYLKHFYDSLTVFKVIDLNIQQKVLDIGTGAGFPGLVLAICFPNLNLTLLDSNNKKIKFLKYIIETLKLNNVTTVYARSEEYSLNNRESYDLVVSRAVAHLRVLLEISFPLLRVNGIFLAMKANMEYELQESNDTIEVLNGEIINSEIFDLPNHAGKRTLIEIKKTQTTPDIYPRNYGAIMKKPLKNKKK